MHIPDLQEIPPLPEQVEDAASNDELVVFIGAGISKLMGFPSWGEFAGIQLKFLAEKRLITYFELEEISKLDPKQQISIAYGIAKNNGQKLNIPETFKEPKLECKIYDYIHSFCCSCVTTNYDKCLDPKKLSEGLNKTKPNEPLSISPKLSPRRIYRPEDFLAIHLKHFRSVVHLHGSIDDPENMVMTSEQYLAHYGKNEVQNFLRDLFRDYTVVFLGYGLSEVEILEQIFRSGDIGSSTQKGRYWLQGFFSSHSRIYEHQYRYFSETFGVKILGFQKDYLNYHQQVEVLRRWAEDLKATPTLLAERQNHMSKILEGWGMLTPEEIGILVEIEDEPSLIPFFFRKARGLKWFYELLKRGYFDSKHNSGPQPADQEGHYRIPSWHAIDYLVNIAPLLQEPENKEYAEQTLEILWSVTKESMEREVSNYRTWWKFALVLREIPNELIHPFDIETYVPYWLSDRFGSDLAGEELGESWLPVLLAANTPHSKELALALVQVLYSLSFEEKPFMGKSRLDAVLPVEKYHLEKITEHIQDVGKIVGRPSVDFFVDNLRQAVMKLSNDSYSSIWRSAVEDHPQNEHKDHELGTLVVCVRDSINGLFLSDAKAAESVVSNLLVDELETLRRIGIHLVDTHYQTLTHLSDHVIEVSHFSLNMRHELWVFLHNHYNTLTKPQQDRVLLSIESQERQDDDGKPHPGFTAYAQAVWLAAIRHHDPILEDLYNKNTRIAGAEPDHPDFSSYMWSGFKGKKSPLSQEEMLSLSTIDLVKYFQEYRPEHSFDGPSIEGLAATFRTTVRERPLQYVQDLELFSSVQAAYLHALIEGYSEAWKAKSQLPWKDIWDRLLVFFQELVDQEFFWKLQDDSDRGENTDWIVNSIGRLLEQGMKDDDWAFDAALLPKAKDLILALLAKQPGSESFKEGCDAVSIAINSPRGNCLEALINYGLRRCRLDDQANGNHDQAWEELEPIFERALNKDTAIGYEFTTLIANYLRNFMYMSFSWTKAKLPQIFDQSDTLRWSCAMEGLAYVGTLHDDIYTYLRDHGDLIRSLDNEHLRDYVHERTVQNIVIGYLRDLEDLNDPQSLLVQLLDRNNPEELGNLISFLSPFKDEFDEVVREKSLHLWPKILKILDKETTEGRKLASRLSVWLGYVKEITDENRDLLYQTIEFAGADYNAYGALEQIARLSRTQPIEAGKLWLTMLKGTSEDYPEKAVREALTNLINHGRDGKRLADEVCSKYILHGTERPNVWRNEILRNLSE